MHRLRSHAGTPVVVDQPGASLDEFEKCIALQWADHVPTSRHEMSGKNENVSRQYNRVVWKTRRIYGKLSLFSTLCLVSDINSIGAERHCGLHAGVAKRSHSFRDTRIVPTNPLCDF